MINLAGDKKADKYIQEELFLAGIPMIKEVKSRGEVPYTIEGLLGDWKFERAWYYWIARAEDGKGLTLVTATLMHETKYPIIGVNEPTNYGQVIRVAGDCGCSHPKEWALPVKETLYKELARLGMEHANYGELAELLNSGKMKGLRFVNLYHIDNQIGLNEFARFVKSSKSDIQF